MDVSVRVGTIHRCPQSERGQRTGKQTDSPAGTTVGWNLGLHSLSALSINIVDVVYTVMLSGGCQTRLLSTQAGIWACR